MLQEILMLLDSSAVDDDVLDLVFEIAVKYSVKCRCLRGGGGYFEGKYDVCDEIFGDMTAGINGVFASEK